MPPTMIIQKNYSFSPFFELSQDYLCIAGYDGYFRKVNPAFVDMIGYSEEELLSFPIDQLIYDPDKNRTADLRENLTKGTSLLNFENRYVTKSGEIVWLSWTSIPLDSDKLIYAIAKNITHIKEQEQERNKLIADLTSINKELTQFSFMATHDLRSPVNNLLSLFNFMDDEDLKKEESLLYMDLLKQSVGSLKTRLDQYIDTFKEKNRSKIALERIDLNSAITKTVEPIKYLIKSSDTTFEIDFSEANFVWFNPFYLQSIFLNLISNSIKYSKPGLPPKIKIKAKKTPNSINIMFEDNGIGFDMKKTEGRLFGLNETFHDHSESKGVGLYLVNNYMRELGGSIELKSKVNEGSVFTLVFRK